MIEVIETENTIEIVKEIITERRPLQLIEMWNSMYNVKIDSGKKLDYNLIDLYDENNYTTVIDPNTFQSIQKVSGPFGVVDFNQSIMDFLIEHKTQVKCYSLLRYVSLTDDTATRQCKLKFEFDDDDIREEFSDMIIIEKMKK